MPYLPEAPEPGHIKAHESSRQPAPLARPHPSGAAPSAPATHPAEGGAQHGLRGGTGPAWLGGSATAPAHAARHIETSLGTLSYTELAPHLAERVAAVERAIVNEEYAALPLDEFLIQRLHGDIAATLVPNIGGRWRDVDVTVGAHAPPPPHKLPLLMRDYVRDLAERVATLPTAADEPLMELLAFAEGRLLSIHPFHDFNGRVTRVFLAELLRRLNLPDVDPTPAPGTATRLYLDALRAADRRDWRPLAKIWRQRFTEDSAAQTEIELTGCTPTPLASYLKALAVLRLVAEASIEDGGDPEATGFWRNDTFVLRTRLSKDELRGFFLERYRPTPIISPWSGRAGFLEGEDADDSDRKGAVMVRSVLDSKGQRFAIYRDAFERLRRVTVLVRLNSVRAEIKEVEGKKKRKELIDEDQLKTLKALGEREKGDLLATLRANLPEACLAWLDTCYVLGQRPIPAPLFGTGGNEGSMDFSVNHVLTLTALMDVDSDEPSSTSGALLEGALFSMPIRVDQEANPGFLSPGTVGGVNMTSGFDGPVSEGGWNAVLALEGALLTAAMAARRHGSQQQTALSAPFFFEAVRGGHGAGTEGEKVRPEFWAPLWHRPYTYLEVRALFAEGRVTLGQRPAETALDVARAMATLGVDRGIEQFQRFTFAERRGKGYSVAAPLQRARVHRNVDSDLINDLDRRNWLTSVQRYARDDNAPNALRAAARQLDTALFALTQSSSRHALQAVLRQIGSIEAALSFSPKAQDAIRSPAPRLSAAWAVKAGGRQMSDSPEFRIAAALAGLRTFDLRGRRILHARRHLACVGETLNAEGDRKWEPESRLSIWSAGPITANLATLLHRRRLAAASEALDGEVLASSQGATCDDLATFLAADTDDARITDLLRGLACVDLDNGAIEVPVGSGESALPPAFSILKFFFTSERLLHALKLSWLPVGRPLRLPPEIPARLAVGDAQTAVRIAWQRLSALGVKLPGRQPPKAAGVDGSRWLAALCIPLGFAETGRLLRALDFETVEQTEDKTLIS